MWRHARWVATNVKEKRYGRTTLQDMGTVLVCKDKGGGGAGQTPPPPSPLNPPPPRLKRSPAHPPQVLLRGVVQLLAAVLLAVGVVHGGLTDLVPSPLQPFLQIYMLILTSAALTDLLFSAPTRLLLGPGVTVIDMAQAPVLSGSIRTFWRRHSHSTGPLHPRRFVGAPPPKTFCCCGAAVLYKSASYKRGKWSCGKAMGPDDLIFGSVNGAFHKPSPHPQPRGRHASGHMPQEATTSCKACAQHCAPSHGFARLMPCPRWSPAHQNVMGEGAMIVVGGKGTRSAEPDVHTTRRRPLDHWNKGKPAHLPHKTIANLKPTESKKDLNAPFPALIVRAVVWAASSGYRRNRDPMWSPSSPAPRPSPREGPP